MKIQKIHFFFFKGGWVSNVQSNSKRWGWGRGHRSLKRPLACSYTATLVGLVIGLTLPASSLHYPSDQVLEGNQRNQSLLPHGMRGNHLNEVISSYPRTRAPCSPSLPVAWVVSEAKPLLLVWDGVRILWPAATLHGALGESHSRIHCLTASYLSLRNSQQAFCLTTGTPKWREIRMRPHLPQSSHFPGSRGFWQLSSSWEGWWKSGTQDSI